METLDKDVKNISTVFPDVNVDEINLHLNNIPHKYHSLRVSLTLRHFFMQEKGNESEIQDQNEKFAALIQELLPEYRHKKIIKKLQIFGSFPERLQLVLKLILTRKENMLKEIEVLIKELKCNGKRKLENDCTASPVPLVKHIKMNSIDSSFENDNTPEKNIAETCADDSSNHEFNKTNSEDGLSSFDESKDENQKMSVNQDESEFDNYFTDLFDIIDKEETPKENSNGDKSETKVESIMEYLNQPLNLKITDNSLNTAGCSKRFHEAQVKSNTKKLFTMDEKKTDDTNSYMPNEILKVKIPNRNNNFVTEEINLLDSDEEDEFSFLSAEDSYILSSPEPKIITPLRKLNSAVVDRLKEIFQDAKPNFIEQLYLDTPISEADNVNVMVDKILEMDYPKKQQRPPSPEKERDLEFEVKFVTDMLPDADPTYIRIKCLEYAEDPEGLRQFVGELLENKKYPTLKDYLRKQQISAQIKQYTTEFSVENFVKLVPDPNGTFGSQNRPVPQDMRDYCLMFLRNKFDKVAIRVITQVLAEHKSMSATIKALSNLPQTLLMKSRRKHVILPEFITQNIPFLQELAFYQHEAEIKKYIEDKKAEKEKLRSEAKALGRLLTCGCCFDDEVMPEETVICPQSCICCVPCVIKSVEISYGEGKLDFPCLTDCGSDYNIQSLQKILPPNLFSKVAQKKALEEIKAAGIKDLEYCPFCEFATIPAEDSKIFKCLNPDCMKESCLLCKEPSHIPLRCDEVEKDDDVKKRTYIENKMTEALLRKCWKCGTSFYKEEGCNKMTCTCGAKMCYLCSQPVTGYDHFNGLGGDQYQKCPLYSDINKIHENNVLEAAKAAKVDLGVAGPSSGNILKVDPTLDVQKHYQERAKQIKQEPYMNQLEALQMQAIRMVNGAIPRPNNIVRHHHHHHAHHHHICPRNCNCPRHFPNRLNRR